MTPPCPTPEERSRQISIGERGPLATHFEVCAACALEWDELRSLRALAAELPATAPAAGSALLVRDRVVALARTEQQRVRMKSVAGWALLAAAATVFAIGLQSRNAREPVAVYRGTLTPSTGARFMRESAEPMEVVRLESGTLHVAVEKLQPGERFLVRAGDGEVEVRGTAFDVTVLEGHLSAVHVDHGRVEVRGQAGLARVLGASEDWRRAAELAIESPAPPLAAPQTAISPRPALPSLRTTEARRPASVSAPLPMTLQSASAPVEPSPVAPVDNGPKTTAAPATPKASETPSLAAPSATGPASDRLDRAREQERRERRDERRDRSDQRRLR